jgi:SAM-dependent methyltransferase
MNPKLQAIAGQIQAAPAEAKGDIYHPLPFPEFDHLKVSSNRRAAYHKWRLIRRALPLASLEGVRVLDVGANAGFYTFNFAKLGARVEAYEPHAHYTAIGRQITDATNLPIIWHNQPLAADDLADKTYDVVLMLSVFQWISQGNQYLAEATELLQKVAAATGVLFFELGCNQGKSAIQVNGRPLPWIWRLLQENTRPKHVSYLGSTTLWRGTRRYMLGCSAEPLRLTPWQRLVTYRWQRQFDHG